MSDIFDDIFTIPQGVSTLDIVFKMGKIIQLMFLFGSFLAVLYIIISAYGYITAFGDESRVTAAKKGLTYAVIGTVIMILSFFIVSFIWERFASQPAPKEITNPDTIVPSSDGTVPSELETGSEDGT